MKRAFFFLALLFFHTNLSRAQVTEHVEIQWKIPDPFPENLKPYRIWLFDPQHYEYDNGNVYFTRDFPGVYGDTATLRITNLRYSIFPESVAEKLIAEKKTDNFRAQIHPYKGRNRSGTFFRINALKYENGRWYKLDAFDLSFNLKSQRTTQPLTSIQHSPFATGDWYRIEVNKTGIYKIDKAFLQQLGVNSSQIDPRNIKLFGWGGRMLPLKNTPAYPLMMPEIAIEVVGEQDGSFDNNDYILFYAVGKQKWNDEYQTHNNIYTDKAYYYLNISPGNGKRIAEMTQPPDAPVVTFTTYLAERFYEYDSVNLVKLGSEWYGPNFNTGQSRLELEFDFFHVDSGQDAYYEIKAATNNPVISRIKIEINGTLAGFAQLPALTSHLENSGVHAVKTWSSGTFPLAQNTAQVTLIYDDGGYPAAQVHLDYFKLKAYCRLQADGRSFAFYHPQQAGAAGTVAYHLSQAASLMAVWDITDPLNIKKIVNPGNSDFIFKDSAQDKRYHTVGNDFLTPVIPSENKIPPSDLAYRTFYPDGSFSEPLNIVIAPQAFAPYARKLVDFHNQRGVQTFFAPLEKIYLEFGNGTQDIAAIRNYLRYVYLNASSPATRLKYVTLLGDTSWDFKKKQYPDKEENINIIPAFQSKQSFSLVSSFVTDDFFVCMDDGEGLMDYLSSTPDVAIGRIPVSTDRQADQVVEKLLNYFNPETYGSWHNSITLISDDADGPSQSWELGLLWATLYISGKLETFHPHFNQNKIYLDAYKQVATSGGMRYPDAKRDLLNSFEKGTLILNFIGHGNEYSWTHERILNIPEIKLLRNKNKLPFVSTITCEFGRFDNPLLYSGAELFVLNPEGGSIQMISTTREVSAAAAIQINKRLYDYLLGTEGTSFSRFRTPGEALLLSKQTPSSINKKIALLGDPAMPLHFARPNIVITDLTGSDNDTVKALQHIRIEGEVQDLSGNLLNDYNGKLFPVVFDKDVRVQTLNNDNVPGQDVTFKKLGNVVFRGSTRIQNGRFSFEFVVPKDLKPNYDYGRINFYSKQGQLLKQGIDTTFIFGGIDTGAPQDNTPPQIKLYLNDYNFADGGITDPNPFLLVDLYDENGINTVGGVGHDIVAVLDDSAEKTFILNDYYVADENTYKSGKIKFKLYGLEPGEHQIKLKAWDTHNNSSEAEIRFRVVEKQNLEINRVLNYPNPFIDYTEFWFSHNRPYETLEVQVQVFSISGKLVWSHYGQIQTQGNTSRDIRWNGLDNFGRKIGKGVYFYKISLRTSDGKTAEKWEKLVKL